MTPEGEGGTTDRAVRPRAKKISAYGRSVSRMFHVSSVRNRESIELHGLDWSRMSGAPGIAGSREPEVEGIFVALDYFTAEFFVRMNNTGGPVDVWSIDDAQEADLVVSDSGFSYLPYRLGPQRLLRLDQLPLSPVEVVHQGKATPVGPIGQA